MIAATDDMGLKARRRLGRRRAAAAPPPTAPPSVARRSSRSPPLRLGHNRRTPWLRLATRDAKTLPILLACHQAVFGIEGRALDDEIEVTEVALDSGGAPLDDRRLKVIASY